jgi:rhamnosyltransferase
MNVTVVIPTYNGGALWKESAFLLAEQVPASARVKVIDSSSKDDTVNTALGYGFEVHIIEQKDFDHGGTRSSALADIDTEFVVFLTQDALLVDRSAIERLISVFDEDKDIVCAYGRQLPHLDATPLAKHARINSYQAESYITSLGCDFPKGFRKAFLSNSFSAYRVGFLRSIGGFPEHLILGEDSFVAAKALVLGQKVAYVAEAQVCHSHNYSAMEEFKRYFDIGVFHSTQTWMIEELGVVEGEGIKFALDQLTYTLKLERFLWFIPSIFASFAKFIGYKLGKQHKNLTPSFARKLSMYKSYWNRVG